MPSWMTLDCTTVMMIRGWEKSATNSALLVWVLAVYCDVAKHTNDLHWVIPTLISYCYSLHLQSLKAPVCTWVHAKNKQELESLKRYGNMFTFTKIRTNEKHGSLLCKNSLTFSCSLRMCLEACNQMQSQTMTHIRRSEYRIMLLVQKMFCWKCVTYCSSKSLLMTNDFCVVRVPKVNQQVMAVTSSYLNQFQFFSLSERILSFNKRMEIVDCNVTINALFLSATCFLVHLFQKCCFCTVTQWCLTNSLGCARYSCTYSTDSNWSYRCCNTDSVSRCTRCHSCHRHHRHHRRLLCYSWSS